MGPCPYVSFYSSEAHCSTHSTSSRKCQLAKWPYRGATALVVTNNPPSRGLQDIALAMAQRAGTKAFLAFFSQRLVPVGSRGCNPKRHWPPCGRVLVRAIPVGNAPWFCGQLGGFVAAVSYWCNVRA